MWKHSIHATEARDKMILEVKNGMFSVIVKMGWCQLEINILCFRKVLKHQGAFIIQIVVAWIVLRIW